MYTIILIAVLGTALLALGIVTSRSPLFFSTADRVFGVFLAGLGSLFAGVLLAMFVGHMTPRHQVVYGPATLVAMHNSPGISGAFLLGSGSINSEMLYTFYERNDDGTLTPNQITADSYVRITEDKTLKDTGSWTSTYSERDPASPLYSWGLGASFLVTQNFRVPVGTVVQAFNLK